MAMVCGLGNSILPVDFLIGNSISRTWNWRWDIKVRLVYSAAHPDGMDRDIPGFTASSVRHGLGTIAARRRGAVTGSVCGSHRLSALQTVDEA